MTSFEERRAQRIERMRERARRLCNVADGARVQLDRVGGYIPLGQPILVGHHSEKRHRRDIERMDALMRKSVDAHEEASALLRRANSAETSTAVSSDDDNAPAKLRDKLQQRELKQQFMSEFNRMLRKGCDDASIAAKSGLTQEAVAGIREPDRMGYSGFPAYRLSNNSAEIRRLKARIAQLENHAVSEPEQIGLVRIAESDNRVRLFFPDKPDEAVRKRLKASGFRWSPTAAAWQRHASVHAWYLARAVAKECTTQPEPTVAAEL
jgi:hypothetical protein